MHRFFVYYRPFHFLRVSMSFRLLSDDTTTRLHTSLVRIFYYGFFMKCVCVCFGCFFLTFL
jgi:hypothetical protein